MKLLDLILVILYFVDFVCDVLLIFLDLLLLIFDFLVFLLVLVVLLYKLGLFGIDFFFQLWDLMIHSEISFMVLSFLLLDLSELFPHQISIRSDSFIQRLLLLQLRLSFQILLLELSNKVIPKFDLVPGIEIFRLGRSCLEWVSIPLFF